MRPCVSSREVLRLLVLFVFLGTLTCAATAATVPTGFTDEEVAGGLESPVGLCFLPDGRILVVEQKTAEIEVIPVGAASSTEIFTVPGVKINGPERGLLGIVADPDWPDRPYVYVHFNEEGGTIFIRMYTVTGDLTDPQSTNLVLSDPYDILTDIPDDASNHNGGTLRFGPDGMLYASVGDDADFCDAQDLTLLKGKILRLDVSSLPGDGPGPPPKSDITPDDNPIPGEHENTRLLYCHGLRNPFRFQIDAITGNLYIGDVGESAWEELDEAFGGDNFGWPKREGAHPYPPGADCPGSDGTDPVWEYDRSGIGASIIADPRYRAGGALGFPAAYDGDVFFHDYYEGFLRRLEYDSGTGTWSPADPVPGQPNADDWGTGFSGVPDMLLGPDGAMYYVSQFPPGMIRRIAGEGPSSAETPGLPAAARLEVHPNPLRGGAPATVRFTIPRHGRVRLSVFDAGGRRIAGLLDGNRSAGTHTVPWDGSPGRFNRGVVFVRLHTGEETVTRKLIRE